LDSQNEFGILYDYVYVFLDSLFGFDLKIILSFDLWTFLIDFDSSTSEFAKREPIICIRYIQINLCDNIYGLYCVIDEIYVFEQCYLS